MPQDLLQPHERLTPAEVAGALGRQGIFVWHGNYYSLPVTEGLGLEPEGMLRIGILHYNTAEEVDRVLDVLRPVEAKGFVILPKRWIVERTFGWLNRHRRLSKDYERLTENSEAAIYVAMIDLITKRLANDF